MRHIRTRLTRSTLRLAATRGFSSSPDTDTRTDRILKKIRCHPSQITVDDKHVTRSKFVPAAFVNHLSLGSIFAWSIFNEPLTRLQGVVVPSAIDWSLGDISVTFSLVMGGFVWGAALSKTLDKLGPRASCLIGASCLGGGFALAGLGAMTGSLPLLYTGGTVWGLANGWAYVPPVAALMKWFPDKRGFASGASILGFGAGAMLAAPLFTRLLSRFRVAPEYLGPRQSVDIITREDSRMFVEQGDSLREVAVATAADLKGWASEGLAEGVYLLGSGDTGVGATFLTLGAGYAALMGASALLHRLPSSGAIAQYVPKQSAQADDRTNAITVSQAMRSKQFWLLWGGFVTSCTGAYGILVASKTMLMESFANYPYVDAAFAGSFVAGVGLMNLFGRLFWSNASDVLAKRFDDPFWARKLTYTAMWGIGPPMYLLAIWSAHNGTDPTNALPLWLFMGSSAAVISSFGGAAALGPAICGDLFGAKNVTTVAARHLSFVLPAAFAGPAIVSYFREKSLNQGMKDIANQISPERFHEAFGAGQDSIETLIAAKTVTLNRLLELAPHAELYLYDNTMFAMATLQATGVAMLQFIKPVDVDQK